VCLDKKNIDISGYKIRSFVLVVRPKHKKCIWRIYNVCEKLDTGVTRIFKVHECYTMGCGYLADNDPMPTEDQGSIRCRDQYGEGEEFEVDLQGYVGSRFEFSDEFSDKDQEEIRKGWNGEENSSTYSEGWLFEGDHSRNFDVIDVAVLIKGATSIKMCDQSTGEVIKEEVSSLLYDHAEKSVYLNRESKPMSSSVKKEEVRQFIDIDTMMKELYEDISVFEEYSDEIRDREDVVVAAVGYCGSLLEHASPRLRDSWSVVKVADEEDIAALAYASDRIRSDKKMVLSSVKMWGDTLEFASDALRSDKQVVLAAIRARPSSIVFAAEALKTDADFIKAARKIDKSIDDYL